MGQAKASDGAIAQEFGPTGGDEYLPIQADVVLAPAEQAARGGDRPGRPDDGVANDQAADRGAANRIRGTGGRFGRLGGDRRRPDVQAGESGYIGAQPLVRDADDQDRLIVPAQDGPADQS